MAYEKEWNLAVETLTAALSTEAIRRQQRLRLPPLWALAPLSALLMMLVASKNAYDVTEYHCYARLFIYGARAVAHVSADSCHVPASALVQAPFHVVPAEYGPLALFLFLPPLLFPAAWYGHAFHLEMALIVVALAFLLERYGAQGAGYAWLLFALIGDMVPATARFDMAPVACVVLALIAVKRQRLTFAYAALALGVLLKLYPLALLPLLLIESWRLRGREPIWRGPALFLGLVAVVEAPLLAFAPSATLLPLTFMGARCVQVDSLPASLGFVWATFTHARPTFTLAFNSTCEAAPGLGAAMDIALALGLVGATLTMMLFWRKRLTLNVASILMLGSFILSSKVLSPQYLLWISPIVALEYGLSMAALAGWGAVCFCTTLCFPLAYDGELGAPLGLPPEVTVPLTAGLRNLLLIGLGAGYFWRRLRPATAAQQVGGAA